MKNKLTDPVYALILMCHTPSIPVTYIPLWELCQRYIKKYRIQAKNSELLAGNVYVKLQSQNSSKPISFIYYMNITFFLYSQHLNYLIQLSFQLISSLLVPTEKSEKTSISITQKSNGPQKKHVTRIPTLSTYTLIGGC